MSKFCGYMHYPTTIMENNNLCTYDFDRLQALGYKLEDFIIPS